MMVDQSSSKYFHVSCLFSGNPTLVIYITIGLIFNSIPAPTSASTATTYSSGLFSYSPKFMRPNGTKGDYYYHAVQVRIYTDGFYSFTSNSSVDTYGSLHYNTIDPTNLYKSLIKSDDDGDGNGQFRITSSLQSYMTYVLLVTTYAPNITGRFTITVIGPAWVDLTATELFMMTSTISSSFMFTSTYSGVLSSSSLTFARPYMTTNSYYYQAIQMTVSVAGTYTFVSNSSIDTYGYFYSDLFDPLNPSTSLMMSDDDNNAARQFGITVTLQLRRTYILVVTTYNSYTNGFFLIKATGPASLDLISINQKISTYCTTLTSRSPTFLRPNAATNCYYYEALKIETYTNGTYTFTTNSSIDTYGYLYTSFFDPSRPSQNLVASNDDGYVNQQFRITYSLQPYRTYFLVVTTSISYTIGTILITAVGPSRITLNSYMAPTGYQSCNHHVSYPSNDNSDNSGAVIGGAIAGSILLGIGIFGCCVYLHKRQKNLDQSSISVENNQNIPAQGFPSVNNCTNGTRVYGTPTAYIISWPHTLAEQPPSYEAAVSYSRTQY